VATKTRQTAEERRVDVLEAARAEFAHRGMDGASTDAIARAAGISQPYLFRLFRSKKELFLAVNDMCFERTLEVFREAARGKSGADALHAMGAAYRALIEDDPTMLSGQLQAYASAVEDRDVREGAARGYCRLVDYVETVSGADRDTVTRFFAAGMLINVLAALSREDQPNDWVARMLEGLKGLKAM
jgi:AcrR family transcriptional regulator